jgi:hypothetical protein
MALPTRDELLAHVELRFYELAPDAPIKLDPNNPAHQTMIRQWHQAHHEMLSQLTDKVFFGYYPDAPKRLNPVDGDHATYIEYWNDIAEQIDGRPGRYDWSHGSIVGAAPSGEAMVAGTVAGTGDSQDEGGAGAEPEEIEMPLQDGSVRLEQQVEYVRTMMSAYADAVASTPLAAKLIDHTWKQVEALRALVKDGTFNTYDHWWRSASYSETIYDEDDRTEELAFVRDLTLEAKIDRTTGVLETHLSGWATDFKKHDTFGRTSLATR